MLSMYMDPYQQPLPPRNPYEFITNPAPPPKRPLLSGGSLKQRLLLIGGGLLVLLLLIAILSALFSSGGKGGTDALKRVAARQAEIVRLAELGAEEGQSTELRAYALNIALSVRSDQAELAGQLTEAGVKLTPQELVSAKSTQADDALEAAAGSNRYDETFRSLIEEQLADYLSRLEAAHTAVSNPDLKAILETSYDSADALAKT